MQKGGPWGEVAFLGERGGGKQAHKGVSRVALGGDGWV